jgi:hypothetical protein
VDNLQQLIDSTLREYIEIERKNSKEAINQITLFVYTSYGKLSNGSWFPANGLVINTAQGIILIDIPWTPVAP